MQEAGTPQLVFQSPLTPGRVCPAHWATQVSGAGVWCSQCTDAQHEKPVAPGRVYLWQLLTWEHSVSQNLSVTKIPSLLSLHENTPELLPARGPRNTPAGLCAALEPPASCSSHGPQVRRGRELPKALATNAATSVESDRGNPGEHPAPSLPAPGDPASPAPHSERGTAPGCPPVPPHNLTWPAALSCAPRGAALAAAATGSGAPAAAAWRGEVDRGAARGRGAAGPWVRSAAGRPSRQRGGGCPGPGCGTGEERRSAGRRGQRPG